MELQQIENSLYNALQSAYAEDSSIRHDPFFKTINHIHQQVRQAVDDANDDALWEAWEKWQADYMGGSWMSPHAEEKASYD